MTTLTDVQFIHNKNGEPEYVVIPFERFKYFEKHAMLSSSGTATIPHEVVGKIAIDGTSPIRAWREYLALTQSDVSERMGISQAAYSQMENAARVSKATRIKIAKAMNIDLEQLSV